MATETQGVGQHMTYLFLLLLIYPALVLLIAATTNDRHDPRRN